MGDQFNPDLTFEAALKQLEETVRRLESGELSLADAIEQYKLSMKLVTFCREQLDKAELEIRQLTESGDAVVVAPSEGIDSL